MNGDIINVSPKPRISKAVRWNPATFKATEDFAPNIGHLRDVSELYRNLNYKVHTAMLYTPEGMDSIYTGYWIIKDEEGEYFTLPDKDFHEKYDIIPNE